MNKTVTMRFKVTQDPCDHPTIQRGVHTVTGSSIDECWSLIETKANEICDDEFTIDLISEVPNE